MPWPTGLRQPNKRSGEWHRTAPCNHVSPGQLEGFAFWLADRSELSLLELHAAVSDELVARGLPLWRSLLGLELLHPEQSGVRSLWAANEDVKKTLAPRGVENLPDCLNSPVGVVDKTGRPFRQKLAGAFGNVGGQTRLDFTVLGPAVNYASRLQSLAKRLGQPVLISSDFANALAKPLVPAGAHAMRDIGGSERVVALPAAA